jgi:hypothetical protein
LFDSQPIETAIGLALMFFVIAMAASSIVEIISQVFKLRAKDLEMAVGQMLAGEAPRLPTKLSELSADERAALGIAADAPDRALTKAELASLRRQFPKYDPEHALASAIGAFQGTSIYEAASAGAKRGFKRGQPSYLAARSFAEGVGEMLGNISDRGMVTTEAWNELPEGLRRRLTALGASAEAVARDEKERALAIRSGIEQWFDDTMERASGAYKRWTRWWLFGIGLVIAISANASAFHVAERLWQDPPTRSAVVSAAGQVPADPADRSRDIPNVARTTSRLEQLKLPIGWDTESRDAWNNPEDLWSLRPWILVLGWIATGLLVTLGAPFWFNLLTQLASLRSTGGKPPMATADGASATSLQQEVTAATPAVAPAIFAAEPVPSAALPAARGAAPEGAPARRERTPTQQAVSAFGLRGPRRRRIRTDPSAGY